MRKLIVISIISGRNVHGKPATQPVRGAISTDVWFCCAIFDVLGYWKCSGVSAVFPFSCFQLKLMPFVLPSVTDLQSD